MAEHEWMVHVIKDLEDYAAQEKLSNLKELLRLVRISATADLNLHSEFARTIHQTDCEKKMLKP